MNPREEEEVLAETSVPSTPKRRGRPPKKAVETNNVTKSESHESCSFGNYYATSNYYFGLDIFSVYSPKMLQSLVQDPMGNNEELRKLSLMLYSTSGVFSNTVDYCSAMPTLDRIIITHGTNKAKKQRNKSLMDSTLRIVNDKEFIRDALFKGMVEGIAFYYFETAERPISNQKYLSDFDVHSILEINELGINASIIPLPTDYTRIVGTKNSRYVLAFNLDYFNIAPGESTEKKLKKFPAEIREAYVKKKNQGINGGNWVVLDNNKTIVHKIRSKREERYGRPIVLGAISDILYKDYFVQTKRNVLDEVNNNIIYQTFPEGKEKGVCALTQAQQAKQHEAVKGAILNKNNHGGTSFFSVAAGTKIDNIKPSNTDIFDSKYESNLTTDIAGDMGIAASLLTGSATGNFSAQENNLELLTAQIFQWVGQIQNELNKCIAANVIKDSKNWVEVSYLPITHVNKKSMVGYCKELYLQGKGSLSLWAAACGISPDAFFALLDEEMELGVEEKYPVHKTSYTMGNANPDNVGGRPETDDPTDNTVASKNNGGNRLASPSDNK